jgi:hypothetical protein
MINRKEVNALTGEEITIELTAKEVADRDSAAAKEKAAEDQAKATKAQAKEALLAKLGISAEEAVLLLQ